MERRQFLSVCPLEGLRKRNERGGEELPPRVAESANAPFAVSAEAITRHTSSSKG